MGETKAKVSFGFSKQIKNSKPNPVVISASPPRSKLPQREFICSIEDSVITSCKVENSLVIPLIKSRSRVYRGENRVEADPTDAITIQALKEINQDAEFLSDDTSHRLSDKVSRVIPLSQTTEYDVSNDVNYEAVPVEKFGMAVLAGMGFKPEDSDIHKSAPIGPIRPKGLGLGADPRAVSSAKATSNGKDDQKLVWKPGARCQAVLGKYNGLYGLVDGMDGDTGRVIVKFAISKEVAAILQPMLRLVTEKEYNLYSKCLNQAEVDRYKAEEMLAQQMESNGSTTERAVKRSIQPISNYARPPTTLFDSNSSECKRRNLEAKCWVKPNLMVKFLDRHYEGGRYYKQKVKVIDVELDETCVCETESGDRIEDVLVKHLQTVVPSKNGSKIMIVHGSRNGEMGRLIDQNYKRNEVDVRTRAGTMIQLTYDQICSVWGVE